MMIAKRDENPVLVRFPAEVLRRVTEAAAANGRSRNTEIVVRISQSLESGPVKKRK